MELMYYPTPRRKRCAANDSNLPPPHVIQDREALQQLRPRWVRPLHQHGGVAQPGHCCGEQPSKELHRSPHLRAYWSVT